MKPARTDAQRRHRSATSKAMKAMVRHCPACGRGQYPQSFAVGDCRIGYVCRYCEQEWTTSK